MDHMTALDAIYGEVRSGPSISRSAIRQLHQVMVAHHPTYQAMNQFGQRFDATLHAGTFKTLPNNPTRPDGVIHQHCRQNASTRNSTTCSRGTAITSPSQVTTTEVISLLHTAWSGV